MRKLRGIDSVTFSGGPGPEVYREVEVLEHAPRPQGLYVRFQNRGSKSTEMIHFRVRGFKNDKLWWEIQESSYSETQPSQVQEAILKFHDYRDHNKTFDLSECRVEVKCLYGFVLAKKTA